jgi:membrane associated rhomboid family serine protease/Zn-finger nucleic acid-binding protein
MLACPNCSTRLNRQSLEHGVVYACPKCGGRSMGIGLLHKLNISANFMRDLWKGAMAPGARQVRDCPHCGRRMSEVQNKLDGGILVLDVCTACQSIWFDPKEHEALPQKTVKESQISDEGKILLGKFAAEEMGEEYREAEQGDPPEQAWQQAVTLLGLPVVESDDEISVRPYLIWGLALVCALTYFIFRSRLDTMILVWGFMPQLWSRHDGLTFITSFFLHANFLHLLFNIYFLLIFGDHLEGLLGRWRLMALILGSHIAGLVAQDMALPHSTMPLVGASAGIAGVLAYYAVSFPRAKVALIWGGFARGIYWIKLPVLMYLAVFIFGEMTSSFIHIGMPSNVANLAHLGGLMVGACAALWARVNRAPVQQR